MNANELKITTYPAGNMLHFSIENCLVEGAPSDFRATIMFRMTKETAVSLKNRLQDFIDSK
jgi:hypothetical protein